MRTKLPTIGIIGSGRLGTVLAKLLSTSDYDVSIINSRGVESLGLQLSIMLPRVQALAISDLIHQSDIIILAVPLPQYHDLPLDEMTGKIVIDAMNYWAPVDGKLQEFDEYSGSSSELVAASIQGATIVKTLNSVAYGELEEHGLPSGDVKRRAIPLVGNDVASKQLIAEMINVIGFDAVDLGELKDGVLFQPDTPLFNQRLTKQQLHTLVPQT